MALNTTVSSPDADSMVTLVEAEAIIELSFPADSAAWSALDDAEKEYCLKQAARFFEYISFRGEVAVEGQAMPFPRDYQTNLTIIPPEVKEAQAEIALNVIYRSRLSQQSVSLGPSTEAQVKEFGLGGLLTIKFSEGGDKSGSVMEQFTRGINSLTWLKLVKHIVQVRGSFI